MKSQKAKPLTRLYFISPILLLALVLGISGQVFCAEIDHYYKSHDALITKSCSNGTWQEVTEYQIDSSNFAAGKKYLIVINFSINTGLDNNQNAMVRVLHGSTPFPDSTYRNETRRNNGAHVGHGYQYWTVWTALSGEDIHIEVTQPTATSVTVRTEEYEAVVMNLEDGLTENTDWFYQTETHSGNLPTSWGVAPGIGASITFDGGGNDWMILAFGHFVHDATTGKYLMRVYDVTDVAAYSQVWHRAVDVDDYRPHMLMIGLTNAGSSHTVRVEARNNTSGVIHDWDYSKIFALNLNKFKDHWTGYSTTAVSLAVLDTWYEVYGKPDYAASQAGNALIWSQEIADVGEATKSIYSRMTLNGLVVPTGHSDAKRELPHGDADETAHHRIYLGSVNAGSNDIDIDMNEDIDVSPAGIIDIHSLCIFSMEKAAFCPTPGTPGSPTPADGVTGQSIDVDLDWSDCTDTDSYDVYFGTSASPPLYASDVAISNYTLPTLEYCTKYYWKIKAKNAGGCSTTGPIWDFTTENGPPGTPSSPDPFDGETGVSKNAVLDWSDCTGTDTYEVYLDKDVNPPTTMVIETADSTYDPDLDWGSTYYWKIVAKNSCGSSTAGDVWTFTTEAAPPADHFVWDASPSQGAPYDSWDNAAHGIQTAINYASAGETVMVRAGTSHTEHVWMHDGKNLVAEEGARPSITWSPGMFVAVVEFTGPMTCNLKGFDIHASTNMGEGVTLDGTGGQVNATIEDCIVRCYNLGVGIRMLGTVNTTIKDCVVYNSNVSMRAGIGTSGWGTSDRIASGSSITIKGTTIGGSGQGVTKAGIRLRGATGASNIRATIGGSGVNDGNTISYNGAVGIILVDIDEVSIENNEISNNGDGGIVLVDSSTVSPHIKNNTIHHQASAAGINIGGASTVTIGDNNNIYANNTGIAFYVANNGASFGDMDPITKTKSSQPVTITGNNIFSNTEAGIAVRDGISGAVTITQNNIYSNTRAGVRMQRSCTLDINRNDIHDNLRGGIHTGSDVADGGGFLPGHIGLGLLTIEKNKIYSNGAGGYGAGIDVRHMPGTIYNNLVYNNYKGGIRFGDYITEIINNTVVGNGNATGGGIAYDDLAGAVNANAAGVPPAPLLIRNNISAYNVSAGIRACFTNTVDSEERDYNLVYSNNGTGETDCGWPDSINMRCANKNFGGCGGKWNLPGPPRILPDGPNNNIADPQFVDKDSDDYQLQVGSPAENAGDDNLDMGAYGGSDPLDW